MDWGEVTVRREVGRATSPEEAATGLRVVPVPSG